MFHETELYILINLDLNSSSQMWLVAAVLDSVDAEHFYYHVLLDSVALEYLSYCIPRGLFVF